MSSHTLEEIFHPQSIAIVGASGNPNAQGYAYTHHLIDYGYKGKIYPVNPKYPEILGIKVYHTLTDIPDSVDYVISCVPASEVLSLLDECSNKGVKCIHLFTARFSETGRQEGLELEREVLKRAREYGIRIIGPNCMGIYNPRVGLSFGYGFPKEPGFAGLASQTGGGSAGLIHLADMRGIRFSKVISYGNALDLNEADFLDYFTVDPETKIILMYIEGIKDGRRFLNSLKKACTVKPVIIVKGGRGKSGTRAVASHTASIAGSTNIWGSAVAQMGAISAENFDEMTDLTASLYFLPPFTGTRVGISGAGGGPGVLIADECEEAGIDVVPLPENMREQLRNRDIPIWDWLDNPADASILGGSGLSDIDILSMMGQNNAFDFLIADMHEFALATLIGEEMVAERLNNSVAGYIKVKSESSKPLMIIVREKSPGPYENDHWSWRLMCEVRSKLIAAGIPFYPSIDRAANAAYKLAQYYKNRR